MNRETGEIRRFAEGEDIPDLFQMIQDEQMTDKQKVEMKVSKYDNKSELGKLFTGNRAERRRLERMARKELKRKNNEKN